MLLVTGGLFLRSFARLQSVNPGFEPRGVHSLKGVPGDWPLFTVLG